MKKLLSTVCTVAIILATAFAPVKAQQKSMGTAASHTGQAIDMRTEAMPPVKRTVDMPRLRPQGMHSAPFASIKNLGIPSVKVSEQTHNMRAAASKRGVSLMGSVVSSSAQGFTGGMYSISVSEPSMQLVKKGVDATGGGTYADGNYYCQQYLNLGEYFGEFWVNQIWDTEAWELKEGFTGDITTQAFDLAYDHVTDKIYGCCLDAYATGEVVCFGTIDMTTYTFNWICDSYEAYVGLAVDADGTLFALSKEGLLYKLDKTTGAKDYIGNTGLVSVYNSSAAIDKATGVMYYVLCNDEGSALYTIDTATAAATKVYDFLNGEEIMGLYVFEPLAGDDAPAAVSDAALNFTGGNLSGSVTFTAPTVTYAGDAMSGELTYHVTVNNESKATGPVSAGMPASVDISLEGPGHYDFRVWVSNAAGDSPRTKLSSYVGFDIPGSVADLALTVSGNTMNLSWSPVTYSLNNGYFDSSAVTYRITRFPDNVVVAENHSGTSFSETLDTPDERTLYYYEVAAVNGTTAGYPAKSNIIGLGSYNVPYTGVFESQDDFNEFTVINANNDSREWVYYNPNHAARIQWHNTNQMDDWLITPGIKLEGGKVYEFSFRTYAHDVRDIERIEAYMGQEPTVEEMTRQLVIPTDVNVARADAMTLKASFAVENTGIYYFGMHGCSSPNTYHLYVDRVAVEDGIATGAPGVISDLSVVPGANGAMEAEITFTAPSVDALGETLEAISKIELSRDGSLIHTFTAPAPGSTLSHKDTGMTNGTHTYSVVAFNNAGPGQAANMSVFTGVNKPVAPAEAYIIETGRPGEVTVSWTPVTTDITGATFADGQVTYTILSEEGVVAENITGSSHTFMAVTEGQEFVYYGVLACTAAGESDYTLTEMIPAGVPYTVPFAESFAGGKLAYEWSINSSSYAKWSLLGDNSGITSADGDNGFVALISQYSGQVGALYSAKIDLTAVNNPVLALYVYGFADDHNMLSVQVNEGDGFKSVKDLEAIPEGWNKIVVPMSDFKGKTVQIAVYGQIVDRQYLPVDNITLTDLPDHNLSAVAISVPRRFRAGEEATVSVTVENNGALAASGYTVELYRDGEMIKSAEGKAVESLESAVISFAETLSVADSTAPEYYAAINYAADQNASDNVTETVTSTLLLPVYPTVDDLSATQTLQLQADLAWTAPVIEHKTPVAVTDDFESYDPFSIDYAGDWTFIDADGSATYQIQNLRFDGDGGRMAYTVFDNSQNVQGFAANSGVRYMGCPSATSGKNDDWLISPRLCGDAQTVRFFAKGVSDQYGNEKFEVHYSTTGAALSDFMLLRSAAEATTDWRQYSVELPAGTRYFAIRCVSEDCFLFMVDDVTYIPAPMLPADLQLTGFNVYRDRKLIASVDGNVSKYADTEASLGAHTYHVTAVYNHGESALSNAADITISELGGVSLTDSDSITVAAAHKSIVVTGAAGKTIRVFGIDGRQLHSSTGQDRTVIALRSGVYVVSAGTVTAKVTVR